MKLHSKHITRWLYIRFVAEAIDIVFANTLLQHSVVQHRRCLDLSRRDPYRLSSQHSILYPNPFFRRWLLIKLRSRLANDAPTRDLLHFDTGSFVLVFLSCSLASGDGVVGSSIFFSGSTLMRSCCSLTLSVPFTRCLYVGLGLV